MGNYPKEKVIKMEWKEIQSGMTLRQFVGMIESKGGLFKVRPINGHANEGWEYTVVDR